MNAVNIVLNMLLLAGFLLIWSGCFFWAIRRDWRKCKADGHAISRLYITDLWTVTLAVSPAIWLLSLAIQNYDASRANWANFGAVAIVFISELLGMFGALIRLASRYGKYPPTRMDRALWLLSGALNGLVILLGAVVLSGCIIGPIATAISRNF